MRSRVVSLWLGSTVLVPEAHATATPVVAEAGDARADERLAALLGRFRQIGGLSANYREEKHMDLLVEPLVSSGTLHYARPGRLARHQKEPTESRVVIVDDALWFDDGVSRQQMDLGKRPAVRMFVDSILLVLAGEGSRLARLYEVEFREQGSRWSLDLRPKIHPVDKIIESIRITGQAVVIEHLIVRETGGDVTRTEFYAVDPDHRFTRSELKRVFGVDPPRASSPP